MPNADAPTNAKGRYSGWYYDAKNDVLELYHKGTKAAQANSSAFTASGATVGSTLAATTTVTAGSDLLAPTGNARLGTVAAFATTQPVAALTMGGSSKGGTAPVGAVATSGALFASDTVVRKIIADGTASNVET